MITLNAGWRDLLRRGALRLSMILWRWACRQPLVPMPRARVVRLKDRPSWWNARPSRFGQVMCLGLFVIQLGFLIYLLLTE